MRRMVWSREQQIRFEKLVGLIGRGRGKVEPNRNVGWRQPTPKTLIENKHSARSLREKQLELTRMLISSQLEAQLKLECLAHGRPVRGRGPQSAPRPRRWRSLQQCRAPERGLCRGRRQARRTPARYGPSRCTACVRAGAALFAKAAPPVETTALLARPVKRVRAFSPARHNASAAWKCIWLPPEKRTAGARASIARPSAGTASRLSRSRFSFDAPCRIGSTGTPTGRAAESCLGDELAKASRRAQPHGQLRLCAGCCGPHRWP